MSDAFGKYMLAQSEKRWAYAEYNSAARKLELTQIHERLAELESQHEPLAKLVGNDAARRRDCLQAAYYVVTGRFLP